MANPEPYNIVKAVEGVPDIEGKHELFENLIPDDAFIAASNYTEKTDQVWREISAEIEVKNKELEKCKAALEVAGIKTATDIAERSNTILPESLIEAIANESKTKDLLQKIATKIEALREAEFEKTYVIF